MCYFDASHSVWFFLVVVLLSVGLRACAKLDYIVDRIGHALSIESEH